MDEAKHLRARVPVGPPADRQSLAEMRLELQAHQIVVTGLLKWYGVFAFTGGIVPSGRCELAAIDSYLGRPFATNCISTEEVERYRHLIESIMSPTAGIPAKPRTLRCRHQLAETFGRAAAKIQTLGSRLESALGRQAQSASPLESTVALANPPIG